jgi:hypothetical protein
MKLLITEIKDCRIYSGPAHASIDTVVATYCPYYSVEYMGCLLTNQMGEGNANGRRDLFASCPLPSAEPNE